MLNESFKVHNVVYFRPAVGFAVLKIMLQENTGKEHAALVEIFHPVVRWFP